MKRTLFICWVLLSALAWAGPRVVVDPGHGGSQQGAVGVNGVFEKNLSLLISAKLKVALERASAKVILTRERDVLLSLADRVALANRLRPDLFISVHANSMPTRKMREQTHGIEVFFLSPNVSYEDAMTTVDRENSEAPLLSAPSRTSDTLAFILADLQRSEAHVESSRLAYFIHQRLISTTGAHDRGVHQAPFFVLMGVEAPAVLVEVGYVSHATEGRKLQDPEYQEKIASAIAEGALAFLNEQAKREAQARVGSR